MRRLITLFSILLVLGSWIFLQMKQGSANAYSTGAPAGATGSPGDNGSTCAQSGCHTGAPVNSSSPAASISSNIPASGYVPGQTYTITASITRSGHNTFGFQVAAEDSAGIKVGSLASTSSSTQLTGGGDYITHTSGSGISGSGGKSWSFDWQAPASGTDTVTFYGAFNVANGDGWNSGDSIHTKSKAFPEDSSSTAIPSVSMMEASSFNVYPNPVRERITVSKLYHTDLQKGKIRLRNLQGKVVKNLYQGDLSGRSSFTFSIDPSIGTGTYLLEVQGQKESKLKRILIR